VYWLQVDDSSCSVKCFRLSFPRILQLDGPGVAWPSTTTRILRHKYSICYIIRWVSALRRAAYTDTHPFVLDIMTIIPRIDSVPSNAPQSRCNYTSLTTTPATQISGNSYIVTLSFLDSSLKHYQSYYLSSESRLPVRKKTEICHK
jgi:hypothetical protein